MGLLALRACIVVDRATGDAKYGICGEEHEVAAWLRDPPFARATHEVIEVSPAEYQAQYSRQVHRVKKHPDGKLRKRDKTYDELRGEEYPQLHQQLDALWHAMDAGEIPKAKQFYDDIKKVKDKYPKP